MLRVELPPHVHMTRKRGREYFAYHPFRGTKRAGQRVPLPGCPILPNGQPNAAWWAAYHAASGERPTRAKQGSFQALADAWTGAAHSEPSHEWQRLAANTQRNYRTALRRILAAWGDLPVRLLSSRHVLELRDAHADTPAAANTMLTALASMLDWSIPRDWRADNPCDKVEPFRQSTPWAAWSLDAIETWKDYACPELRRAMMLALYTGQRRSDLILMTWADVDQGVIQVVQEGGDEGQKKTGKKVWVPLHRDLRAELATAPRTSTRILVGDRGRPYTLESFKTAWQRQQECIDLVTGECHGLVLHGLRKSAVCFLLDAGCSEQEVEAITRQSREMIRHYAADLNRQRLARSAIARWENTSSTV